MISFWWSHSIGFGFLAGVTISVLNFQLMAVDAYGITGKAPKKARKFIIGRSAVRFAIMFVFLALIAHRTDLNIIATFIGLFFVQAILVGEQLLHINYRDHKAGNVFKGLK